MTTELPTQPLIEHLVLAMPAYNEAPVIEELLDRAIAAFSLLDIDWLVIVVDDGSSDETAENVKRVAEREARVRLVQHEQNKGLGPAILTGLQTALELRPGDKTLVVGMDADLTHPPEIVTQMVDEVRAGAHLVIASRYQPGSEQRGVNAFRQLLSWGARRLFDATLALEGVRDYTCGFRGIHSTLIEKGFERFGREGLIERDGFACTDELLVKLALFDPVIREIPFILRYDMKQGESKIKLGVTIAETLRLVWWARKELRAARKAREESVDC